MGGISYKQLNEDVIHNINAPIYARLNNIVNQEGTTIFEIFKVYDNASTMIADKDNVQEGKTVSITSPSSKLYKRQNSSTEDESGNLDGYLFLGELSQALILEGPEGVPGEQGEPGKDGEPGKSAYEIAVEEGKADESLGASFWIDSLKGDKSDPGEQGIQGIQGIAGPQGPKGDKGDKGDLPTLDSTPTIGSLNGVTSGGTAQAIKTVSDKLNSISNQLGGTQNKNAPILHYLNGWQNKYIKITAKGQSMIQLIDDYAHYIFAMDSTQVMWSHVYGCGRTDKTVSLFWNLSAGEEKALYMSAKAATPVALYNDQMTSITFVDTLPESAMAIVYKKIDNYHSVWNKTGNYVT